jgi:pantetheine-phosphate adenylyltransferase
LKEIELVLVDYVLAEDGLPISSSRIKRGEIDEHGKVL